jgi:hypothetical protein
MKISYVRCSLVVVVVLCVISAILTLLIRSNKTSGESVGHTDNLVASTADIRGTPTPVGSQIASEKQLLLNIQSKKTTQLPSTPFALRTLNTFRQERPSSLDALKNWDALLRKSTEGDAESKITVFEAANWCISQKVELLQVRVSRARGRQVSEKQVNELAQTNDTCKIISEDTSARRFDFLESAAASGNQEAMVAYEKYLFMAPQNDPAWVWRNSEKVGEMSFKAVSFLEQAASQGIKEAFDELASIYGTGRYGYKDEGRANAYRLQLSKLALSLEEHRLASK